MSEAGPVPQLSRQGGVSLIEVIVALAVVGLTLALAATSLRLLAHSGERGARLVSSHDILSRGIDVLRRDVERLERVVRKRGDAEELAFYGDATRLALVAIEPSFPTEPGAYVISYTIAQDRDGVTLTRGRAPFDTINADILAIPVQDSVAVIEGSYRLRFLYLDRKKDGDHWLDQWTDAARLPALIALDVVGPGNAQMPRAIFRPRIDGGPDCTGGGSACSTAGNAGAAATDTAAGSKSEK